MKDRFREVNIQAFLPYRGGNPSWDREEVQLFFTPDGEMKTVVLNEHFSHTQDCMDLEDLYGVYNRGRTLTPAQLQLLHEQGYKAVRHDNVPSSSAVKLPDESNILPSPLSLLVYTLPEDLQEVLQDRSKGYFYATGSRKEGILQINHRLHDYGEMQFTVTLDVAGLPQDVVYKTIGFYIDAVKNYPAVEKRKN